MTTGENNIQRPYPEDFKGWSDNQVFEWRNQAREYLATHDDSDLRESFMWSSAELDTRAKRAWSRTNTE